MEYSIGPEIAISLTQFDSKGPNNLSEEIIFPGIDNSTHRTSQASLLKALTTAIVKYQEGWGLCSV